ncbi:MAG: MraY family glycosyltransferase [Planctomycetota bacterium]
MSPGLLVAILSVLFVTGLVVSLLATRWMIGFAPKIGLVDKPGHRKIHDDARPLGGGTGIFLGVAVPMVIGALAVALIWVRHDVYQEWLQSPPYVEPALMPGPFGLGLNPDLVRGIVDQLPLLATFLAVGFGMFLLGLVDDRRALGPFVKLGVQLGLTVALVLPFPEVRLLTVLGLVPSVIITTLWIAAVTNALNFLDNMDGLAGGVAAISGLVLLLTSMLAGQVFVPATLALFVGACVGFLWWNFPPRVVGGGPARIFMGDSGSLFVGLVLGVMTVRTTYVAPGADFASLGGGWYGIFAPLVVLAVPLYDMTVVSLIRLSRGKSPFVGDTNHFSHRLVRLGMTKRTAVLCIWLVSAATGVAALLLPLVTSPLAAWLIFLQTLLILGVILLLERGGREPSPGRVGGS